MKKNVESQANIGGQKELVAKCPCGSLINPFGKIAGWTALWIGLAGLAVSVVFSAVGGLLPIGLLKFGPTTIFPLARFLIIWLVPSAIFWGMGAALSRSRIRAVDVFGTVAFALLPLAVLPLGYWALGLDGDLRAVMTPGADLQAIVEGLVTWRMVVFGLLSIAALAVMVVWLFNAVKVSCNLRGGRLWATYLVGLLVGDFICRMLIGQIV